MQDALPQLSAEHWGAGCSWTEPCSGARRNNVWTRASTLWDSFPLKCSSQVWGSFRHPKLHTEQGWDAISSHQAGAVPLLCVRATGIISHLLQDWCEYSHFIFPSLFGQTWERQPCSLVLLGAEGTILPLFLQCSCTIFCKILLSFCVVSISVSRATFQSCYFLTVLAAGRNQMEL